MSKFYVNKNSGMPGLEHVVEAERYSQEGDLIHFYDADDNQVFSMRADTLMSIQKID